MTGMFVACAMFQVVSSTSFIWTRPTSGLPRMRGGQAVAGDLDGLEAAGFDDLGAQGVVTAGHDNGAPGHDGFSQNSSFLHI